MENYDPRRRQSNDDSQRRRSRSGSEDSGGNQESWRPQDEERYSRRQGAEDFSGSPNFSPDWSREGAEPRYSDDPYYSRNRDRGGSSEYSRGGQSRGWQGDENRTTTWEERARGFLPREQYEMAERSRRGGGGERGDYYSPDWPYERGNQGRGSERSHDDGQSYYRGVYSRSSTPFSYGGGRGHLIAESLTLTGPYTGRGPKGYQRSDQQIIEEACQRLERDGDIDASEIEVTAEEGTLRLRGTVPDRATKRRAEECVESVYGARDVMNELRVSAQSGQEHGSQRSQQAGRSAQPSQGSQSAGSQASQPAGSQSSVSPSARPGGSSSGAEQAGDDKHSPKH